MAILKALISVARADGRLADEEMEVIEALLQAFGATPSDVGTLGNSAAGGGTRRQVDRPTSAQRVPGPSGGARRAPQQTPGPNVREPRDPRDPREPGEVRDPGDRRDPRLR